MNLKNKNFNHKLTILICVWNITIEDLGTKKLALSHYTHKKNAGCFHNLKKKKKCSMHDCLCSWNFRTSTRGNHFYTSLHLNIATTFSACTALRWCMFFPQILTLYVLQFASCKILFVPIPPYIHTTSLEIDFKFHGTHSVITNQFPWWFSDEVSQYLTSTPLSHGPRFGSMIPYLPYQTSCVRLIPEGIYLKTLSTYR